MRGTKCTAGPTHTAERWFLSVCYPKALTDYRSGLIGAAERGVDADAYAAGEPDVALWEGERCLALIRPLPGGEPEVLRFEAEEGEDLRPRPTTEEERHVWSLVKRYGAGKARDAILEKMHPATPRPGAGPLTGDEETLLATLRRLGRDEVFDRLYLAGAYGVIGEATGRLGTDAVAELRRMARERDAGAC